METLERLGAGHLAAVVVAYRDALRLFAQTLGTPAPVSEKRILAALDRLSAR